VGNGLGTLKGEPRRRRRRLLQPAFTRTRIAGYTHAMTRTARERIIVDRIEPRLSRAGDRRGRGARPGEGFLVWPEARCYSH
jgi:hypothetical protein